MEFIGITSTGWAAIFVTLSMAVLSVIMVVLGKERVQYIWAWFCTIVTVWIGAFYLAVITTDPSTAVFWWKISYVGIILIPFGFLHFVFYFVDVFKSEKLRERVITILYFAATIFIFLDLQTKLIVNGVKFSFNEFYYGQPGLVHPYFFILYLLLVSYGFYLISREYKKSRDKKVRQRLMYFFVATLIAFLGGSLNFLPIYGIKIPPTSNISVVVGVVLISFAILRYRLFNTKIVMAQLLTLVLASFAIIRLVVSDSTQLFIFNSLILGITIFVGFKLIGSVTREVEQRELLEKLDKELESANEQLKQLDKARAEFISIASHQLRTPPATIKWYLAAVLGGDYGDLNDRARKAIQTAEMTNNSQISLIDDMLNASRIERGKMEFIFEPTDLLKITQITVDQLTPQAAQRKQNLVFNKPKVEIPQINADKEKLRQVINNLIDNAIKYSPTGGTIIINLEKTAKDVLVKVTDTGRGIKPDELGKIFVKYDRGGRKMDSQGLGLGLYVAKVVVEQHQGKIWAESPGEGKGSTFVMQIPIKTNLTNSTFDLAKKA